MMNRQIFFFSVCCLLCALSLQAQSGWTRTPKSLFLKFDATRFSSDKYYNASGMEVNTTVFRQTSFNLYGEYGFRDRLTFILHAPLLRANSFETTSTVYGVGDLKIEAKYQLSNKKIPVAVSIAPELPTGRANAFALNNDLPDTKINLPTGDGEFNVWTTLAASTSFGKSYVSVFGAYNFRTQYKGDAFHDLYQFGAELGYNPYASIWLNAKIRTQHSTGDVANPNLSFVRGDATTYTIVSVEAYYKVAPRWGIAATYFTGNDWLSKFRNIYIAPYFSVGVVYEK